MFTVKCTIPNDFKGKLNVATIKAKIGKPNQIDSNSAEVKLGWFVENQVAAEKMEDDLKAEIDELKITPYHIFSEQNHA